MSTGYPDERQSHPEPEVAGTSKKQEIGISGALVGQKRANLKVVFRMGIKDCWDFCTVGREGDEVADG